MNPKKLTMAAVSAAAAGLLIVGGTTIANAADDTTPTTTSSTATSGAPGSSSDAATKGTSQTRGASQDTPVTGDEAAKVSKAVTDKDSTVTVSSVRKDPDGSYDVLGTKSGANVMFDVSADLATITENAGGGGGGHHGGMGGASQDTPVTGTEADQVTAAVTAKDSTITVTSVRKDPDGSYDALGTKAGANVLVDVSKDLSTVTVNAGGGMRDGQGANSAQPDQAPTTSSSSSAS